MENPISEAKIYYQSIGRIWCPTLGDHIVFNSMGFKHLIRSGKKRRLPSDQMRRFRLLPIAVEMVSNPQTNFIPSRGETASIQFWVAEELRKLRTVTVVIRQKGDGNKHFFSVYN